MRVIRPLLACAALVLSTARPARAQTLTLVLEQPLVTGVVAPSAVSFVGTLTNTGTTTLFLNGTTVTSSLSVDVTPFLANAPTSIAPGAIFTTELFRALVPGGTASGSYGGTFYVLGGPSNTASSVLASASFDVGVGAATSTVPEPGTTALVASGVAALALARARRRARRRGA
ncbi:PEP-CTERM sorting domain-containing protein [Roseisolibacter agri]|nr:PEP-CTERM sorting domain-containing protein [Roseisolibacter agri]